MKTEIKYLSQEELNRFFKVITDLRDRALFLCIYKYGLRASEAAMLEINDIDFVRRRIVIRRKKNGVSGEYLLMSDLIKVLKTYSDDRKDDFYSSLFLSKKKNPISRQQIDHLFKYYADKAKLPKDKRHVHTLRHSIAVHMLDASQSIELVQDLLGHKDIRSSTIYAKISSRRRSQYLNALEKAREIVKVSY